MPAIVVTMFATMKRFEMVTEKTDAETEPIVAMSDKTINEM
jgi:hypothetical protein